MDIVFTPEGWNDFSYWITEDRAIVAKIQQLLRAIRQEPFRGIGKPEPLKQNYQGYWSRRINKEHRLVYRIAGKRGEDQRIIVVKCRFHY
ncbi:MAG: Txe/YoeB family addiction module toxin [Bacteroidota bacterium]